MAEQRRWVTMADVAKEAGVGTITVSRVLRTPDKVRPATRTKVEQAISKLGYVPDAAAGALSSRRSRIVGAVISTLANSVFAETIDGLSASLAEEGRSLLLANTDYSAETEGALIEAMLAQRPDGLVLTSGEHTPKTRRRLIAARVPVVEVWDLPDAPICHAVGFSNRAAGRTITEYLADVGARRIGFIGRNAPDDHRGRLRAEGYAQALAARGLGGPLLADAGAAHRAAEVGAAGLSDLLARQPDLDAVFCASDAIALGALCEARRRGLETPERLAIAGFGDFDIAASAGLGLTTVRAPGRAIGAAAARLLIEAADAPRGAPAPSQSIDLGFEIVRRATA